MGDRSRFAKKSAEGRAVVEALEARSPEHEDRCVADAKRDRGLASGHDLLLEAIDIQHRLGLGAVETRRTPDLDQAVNPSDVLSADEVRFEYSGPYDGAASTRRRVEVQLVGLSAPRHEPRWRQAQA